MPSYPSYEFLWKNGTVNLNLEAERIGWILQDPLEDSIFVMDNANEPSGPRQPGFQPGTAPDGGPNLHPVAHLSLCEPPISSIIVSVGELQYAAEYWGDMHTYDPDDDPKSPCGCCGLSPPPEDETLAVVAGKEGGFVTIGDYIAAVHPWLMSFRSAFLTIKMSGSVPWPEDTTLMPFFPYPDDVMVDDEKTWISSQNGRKRARQLRAEKEAQLAQLQS